MAQDMKTPKDTVAAFSEPSDGKGKAPHHANSRRGEGNRAINIFDIVVIVLLVAAIVIATSSTQLRELFRLAPESTECTVEYMIMFSDVDEDFAYAVANGNAVYHAQTKASMGMVTADPEVQAHRIPVYADGEAQMKDKPGAVDVIVTVRASAEYIEGVGYTVGTTTLRVGSSISLRFPGYSGVGQCIHVGEEANAAADRS